MKNIWKVLRGKKDNKLFDAIQIEVSAACNLKCKFCPTTYLNSKDEWKFLTLPTFKKLEPYFKLTRWVYLQGWGEPLINKDIWDMVSIVKEAGSQVGFTTNGTLLKEEVIDRLVLFNVDLVSTSIAGASAETHEKLRVNSSFLDIIESVERLVKAKERSQKRLPFITLSYMLTKESVHELLKALELAYSLGVDDFYTTNLDYVFSQDVNNSKIFTWENEATYEYEQIINKAEEYALVRDFPFRSYPLKPAEEKVVCDLNPAKMVFISSSGDVAPCTYLGRFINPRYYKKQIQNIPRKTFGNIHCEDFLDIWNKESYQDFRRPFIIRAQFYQKLISSYTDYEPNLTRIKNAEKQYSETLIQNPLPEECKTCPKRFGI
ncbi:MAG: hypothetical protein JM58_02020 [Peptococcaceae bacterium BICA1-8]|nr:MAG: hypothetical protein JM58_02020 [Peptococcaceae bacterium BICA1-8]